MTVCACVPMCVCLSAAVCVRVVQSHLVPETARLAPALWCRRVLCHACSCSGVREAKSFLILIQYYRPSIFDYCRIPIIRLIHRTGTCSLARMTMRGRICIMYERTPSLPTPHTHTHPSLTGHICPQHLVTH